MGSSCALDDWLVSERDAGLMRVCRGMQGVPDLLIESSQQGVRTRLGDKAGGFTLIDLKRRPVQHGWVPQTDEREPSQHSDPRRVLGWIDTPYRHFRSVVAALAGGLGR